LYSSLLGVGAIRLFAIALLISHLLAALRDLARMRSGRASVARLSSRPTGKGSQPDRPAWLGLAC